MGGTPDTAVIVPTYGRPAALKSCLEALTRQDCEDFEVIVVDDGSPEPVSTVCARFAPLVRCIRQENAGPGAARNRGAAATDARFIAFTDDDCLPDPTWLRQLRDAQGGVDGRLVGGAIRNGLGDELFAEASMLLCAYLYECFGAETSDAPFFTSNNIGCLAADFRRFGGFDHRFWCGAEDREMCLRWSDLGGSLSFAPTAEIEHRHRLTLSSFWEMHSRYGEGARLLHQVLDERGSKRPRLQPLSFYLGLIFHPVRARGWRAVRYLPVMALTQLAMVHGYFMGTGAAAKAARAMHEGDRPA
ncbi:MAG: glycosyltransferase [Pseudomonadota bacterium]